MKISLNKENVQKIKQLLILCPSNFSFIPLKLYKDAEGNEFVSVETISINGDIVFSGRVSISDSLTDLEAGTGMIVRLPLTKPVVHTIFGGNFETVEISKTKIYAKDSRKKLDIALYKLEDGEQTEFPFESKELFELVKEMNHVEELPFISLDLEAIDLKDIISGFAIINDATNIEVKNNKKGLNFKVEDFSGNSFNYSLNTDVSDEFDCKFDTNFIKLLGTAFRNKELYSTEFLFSPLIFSTTLKNNDLIVTIATTAIKE